MRNLRPGRIVSLLCLILIASLIAWACGDDGSLQAGREPALTIDGTSGEILLEMPPDENRPQKQQAVLSIRNSGERTLKVTRLEIVSAPPRLVPVGEQGGACTSDEECGSGEICFTQSQTCVGTSLPETFEVGEGLRRDIEFLVKQGPCELECPEAPADVPEEIAPRYCGHMVIETNAINDNALVDEGKATIYFLDPGVRGRLEVTPTAVEYTGVTPGSSATQSFSIQNTCNRPMRIDGVSINDRATFFASIQNFPADIEPGGSETFELTLQPPADAQPEELDFNTVVAFDSTAINDDARLAVFSTAGIGAAPAADISPGVLKFDQSAQQTLSIENKGQATLLVNDFRIEPDTAEVFYTILIDGNPADGQLPVSVPKQTDPLEVTIEFNRPAGNTDSSVATLIVGHNDENAGFSTNVTLLGDEGDQPIAMIFPTSFTYLAASGNMDTRDFVIRNVGTAPLTIDSVDLNFQGSESEFEIIDGVATVAPGALHRAQARFTGTDTTQDNGTAVFNSNNATGELTLGLSALPSPGEVPVPVATPGSTNDPRVGNPVNYTAADSTPAAATQGATWTLLSRPSGSTVFLHTVGEEMSFIPDVAGTYEFSLVLFSSGAEAQETFTVEVQN